MSGEGLPRDRVIAHPRPRKFSNEQIEQLRALIREALDLMSSDEPAKVAPEPVLSPTQTDMFGQMVARGREFPSERPRQVGLLCRDIDKATVQVLNLRIALQQFELEVLPRLTRLQLELDDAHGERGDNPVGVIAAIAAVNRVGERLREIAEQECGDGAAVRVVTTDPEQINECHSTST
ncbi:hypothetical protein ABQF35_14530 [Mycobacterium syngnathidarum]